MTKIKERIRHVVDRITSRKADLAKARRLHKRFRELAEAADDNYVMAKNAGRPRLAALRKRKADRLHAKAIYWKGKVRRDKEALPKLEVLETKLEQDLAEFIKKHGVTFEGENKVRGGTYEARAHAVQVRAMQNYNAGTSTVGPTYYSMEGGPRDYAHILYHYPQHRIYDCSTYADGTCYVTGDPSPSGPNGYTAGGYTGTELEYCHKVTGEVKCGDLVVYLRYSGDTTGHHVERVLDPKAKTTTGHGDSAINIGCNGSWDIFGDGLYVIVRPPRTHAKH